MVTETEPETGAVLAEALLEQIGGLRRALRHVTAAPWPGGELTGAQVELVRLLRREPGLSVNRAAQLLRLAPNTVSALIGRLVAIGLVERRRDADDRRVVRLELSERASDALAAWRDERAHALAAALGRLGGEERQAVEAALPALARVTADLAGRATEPAADLPDRVQAGDG